jgi:predicted ATPase/class 3 adenylate cyclase
MSQRCISCGFTNPPGMRFCGNCGARLPEAPSKGELPFTPADLRPEQLGVMMGVDLLERFRQAGLEAGGQRRSVTILFADLTGYTQLTERLDSEEVFDLLQQYLRLLIDIVYRYEGMVDKLTGDGLMALFGAPIAHENNAERAVRAAFEMQASVQQLSRSLQERLGQGLEMRIGLNDGAVIVGGLGADMLMNYTAVGDTVNLARRLEEAAEPGTILVSESVYRQTRVFFEYEATPALALKGITEATAGYRVTGLKAAPATTRGLEGLTAPMIGRERELSQLKEAVNALTSRKQGRFILVIGEAGIGKTRLTNELKTAIDPATVSILEGHSLTYRRSVSYWIFLDVLRRLLGVEAGAPEIEVSGKLIQRAYQVLGRRAGDILPYLEQMLSLKPSDPAASERLQYLDAGQLRRQIFLAVRDLLAAEARRRPLLLILDDLHWADEASLDLLQFLLESISQLPILILGVSRPPQSDNLLARLTQWAESKLGERFLAISLHNLSLDQSEDLLRKLLHLPELPGDFRTQIIPRAAGVPFYLEELLRTLIDRKAIRRVGERWELVPGFNPADLGVPDTLQGLILARFDRLSEPERRILQIASVIGQRFNLALLGALLSPEEVGQLENRVSRLVLRDFLVLLGEAGKGEYAFRHMLMSEAIYHTLLRRERAMLHGQVAAAIETLYADRLDEQVELLARHYAWSAQTDKALHYLILAGARAARSYFNTQAIQNYTQALELLPNVPHTPEQAVQINLGLGDLLVLAGEYENARQHYWDAITALGTLPAVKFARQLSTLQRKIATTYERQGDYDQALLYLAQSQASLAPVQDTLPSEEAQILNETGWIHFRRGNLDEAERLLTEALGLVESTLQYDITASLYNRLGGVYYQKGQLDLASKFVRKSLVLREEIGDIAAVARSANNLGLLSWTRGDWDNALEHFTRSVELHASLGDVEGTIESNSNLGLLQLDRGKVEAARQHLQKALSTAEQIGHSYNIGIIQLYFCRLCVSTGDWAAAIEHGTRSLTALQELGAQDDLVNVYTYLGFACLGQGDLDQAQMWGEKALAISEQASEGQPPVPDENRARALRLQGEVAAGRGDTTLAEQLLKASAGAFEAIGNQIELGRSTQALARLAARRGDLANARMLVNEARLIFRQLGAHLDLNALESTSTEILSR